MKKHHLYIILIRTNTVLSNLIHYVRKDAYTHAAIALDKDFSCMYSFGRRRVYNPFIGRFVKESMYDGLYKLHDSSPCKILEIEVSEEQYVKAEKIIRHFISNSCIYKYNYIGLLYNLLNKETLNNRFMCSEFVYYVLRESGIIDFNVPKNLVRPSDLLSLESTTLYQGNVGLFVNTASVNSNVLMITRP